MILYITGQPSDLRKFFIKVERNTPIRNAFIIGGGKIAVYLCEILYKQKIIFKLVEKDREKAKYFASKYPEMEIVCGDGSDREFLISQGIKNYDILISLTGLDEENMILSLVAEKLGVKRSITKVSRPYLIDLFEEIQIASVVNPQSLVSDLIVGIIRAQKNTLGTNIRNLHRIANNKIEISEFHITKESNITNIPLTEIDLINNTLITYIIRKGNIIVPTGNDMIQIGDYVIICSKHKINEIEEIVKS